MRLALMLLLLFAGCETPAPISPEVDDAFCLVLCIAVELQPTNEVATDIGAIEIVPVKRFEHLTSDEVIRIYIENESEISKVWASLDGQENDTMADAVTLWMAQQQLKESAGASNSRVAIEDGERPAQKAADKTPLSFITPIILHTKPNCPPCREVKAALIEAGIPFIEHTTADVAPVAFVDDERFEGYKILDRFNLSRESK